MARTAGTPSEHTAMSWSMWKRKRGTRMPERMLNLAYENMLAPRLDGRGIDPGRLRALAGRFKAIHAEFARRRAAGDLPMLELPTRSDDLAAIRRLAEHRADGMRDVVVLGIGGSALGTIALREALLPSSWNTLDAEARDGQPRLYVMDNIDPETIGPFLERLDLRHTLFNVVSKSGSTAEAMAQYLVVRDRLERDAGIENPLRHLVFTTDPERGALRRIANAEEVAALAVPPGVGGRFSVLSAVGLFPATLAGIDAGELLEGAGEMLKRCAGDSLSENPAGLYAALQYLADTERDARIHVMMAYSDRLGGIADWFRQLWAESLGKRHDLDGNDVFRGPTPVKARGATDQHSQVQLYMEGPFDKTVTLLSARARERDVPVPERHAGMEELAYLGGSTLGELLDAERRSTALALTRRGRMNMSLELPRVEPRSVGGLLMFLQLATVYAGAFYRIDPLDQPGVELGKEYTYGLMGRSGYEELVSAEGTPATTENQG